MTTEEERRERLSKAMGAAFLSHQVAALERSVDSINFSRDSRLYNPEGSSNSRGGKGSGRGGRGRGGSASSNGRGGGGAGGGAATGRPNGVKRETRVVDASALVNALPVLKRWVRDDVYQLVVPLQVLSTLDILKRAPNPLHDLARDATRFLETQLNIARQIESSYSTDADSRIRLRAQAAQEELPWSEVEKLFTVPEGFVIPTDPTAVVEPSTEEDEEEEELPPRVLTAADIPKPLRSTLQCALFFHRKNSVATTAAPPLVLFNKIHAPDYTYHLPPPPRAHNDAPPPAEYYTALSAGDALAYWLNFFPSTSTCAITCSEVVAQREYLKAQASARDAASSNHSGGKGRGGNSSRGRGGSGGQERSRGQGKQGGSAASRGQSQGVLFVP